MSQIAQSTFSVTTAFFLLFLVTTGPIVAQEPIANRPTTSGIEKQPLDNDTSDDFAADIQRYDFVLTLDTRQIKQLQETGFLKANLPAAYLNLVDSVILKQSICFLNEIETLSIDVDKRQRTLAASIDQSVVDQLPYQPVKIKIYESNFSSVLLRYRPDRVLIADNTSKLDPVNDSPLVWLQLKTGKRIPGNIRKQTSMVLQSQFGKLELPFGSFAGIGFPASESKQKKAVIVFDNGDNISGNLGFDSVVLRTRWGDKTFHLNELQAITKQRDTELIPPLDTHQTTWSVRQN